MGVAPFYSAEDQSSGGSASVSLAPPAWAARLLRGAAARRQAAAEDDDLVQQGSLQLSTVESLRESSVVVRPIPPPLQDAATPPVCGMGPSAAGITDGIAALGSASTHPAAQKYTAEVNTTFRPIAPPPPGASPLAEAYLQRNQPLGAAAAAAGGVSQHMLQTQVQINEEEPLPSAPLQPPSGRLGWFRHQQPTRGATEMLPGMAAMEPLSSTGWGPCSLNSQGLVTASQVAAGGRLPNPPSFCPPSAASMVGRLPTSQQQLLAAEAHMHDTQQVGGRSGGKPSPTKSIDASTFHLDAYAGVTAAVEEAAARLGSQTQPAGQRPSRTAALRQRHLRQLQQQDRDQYGVPVASSARPFSLWASPQKIGEACTGLGVYFASLKQCIVVALLLSLVAIYPLASNVTSQSWAHAYTLKAGQAPLQSCNKGWDTSSWVTGTTAGSRCSSTTYSSSFDCPAICSWSAARLAADPRCLAVPLPTLRTEARGATASCLLHPPCSSSSAGSTDPAAPDGPCYCCALELDSSRTSSGTTSAGTLPAAQLWVLLLGQLLFLVWVLFLTRSQLRAVHKADARVITASDYTAIIHGVPATVGNAELQEWCSHYGSVVAAYNIQDVGDAIRVAQRLQMLLVRRAESDAWLASSSCTCSSWWFNLCALGAISRMRLQRRMDSTAHKLRCYERQDLQPTGTALAMFEYAEHASNMIEDHHQPAIRRALDTALCGTTVTAPRLASKRVRVRRAPEPSDILWHNTACTGSAALTRRLVSAGLTLLIMAAGAGVQYGLAMAAEDERKNKISTLYSYDSEVDGRLDFSSWAAFTASALEVTKLNAISILSGLAVVAVNWLVTIAVRKLMVLERWHTRTAGERWALLKLSVAYLANAFVVPLLAAQFAGSSNSWYSRGGLMESAFYMQVANALLPPLATLLDLEDLLYYCLVSRWAKTQAMLNSLLEPPPFLLAEQYASSLTTLGVAVCWMPVLPISPYIALLGLFLAYWADKIVALRRAAHPGNMRGKLVSSAALLIRLLPLVQLLLMRFLYFRDEHGMVAVFWAGLAVWLLFAIAPLRMLFGLLPRRRSTVTGGLSYQETLGSGQRRGQDDCYLPEVPLCCSPAYQQQVAARFKLLPAPQPAIEVLLPRQNPALGSAATRPPFRPNKDADRIVAQAAASLRARQQVILSIATSISGRQGPGGFQSAEQQPGSSRLSRGLTAVKDSVAGGASWLFNTPNPDDLFSYDWRHTSDDGAPRDTQTTGTSAHYTMRQQQRQPPTMSPFQPMGTTNGHGDGLQRGASNGASMA